MQQAPFKANPLIGLMRGRDLRDDAGLRALWRLGLEQAIVIEGYRGEVRDLLV